MLASWSLISSVDEDLGKSKSVSGVETQVLPNEQIWEKANFPIKIEKNLWKSEFLYLFLSHWSLNKPMEI